MIGLRRILPSSRCSDSVGISAEMMLFPDASFARRHFDILEDTLLRLLELEA